MKKAKIRYHTWYWGNYILEGDMLDGSRITLDLDGFERYDEDKHSWKNSEEFKSGQLKPHHKE